MWALKVESRKLNSNKSQGVSHKAYVITVVRSIFSIYLNPINLPQSSQSHHLKKSLKFHLNNGYFGGQIAGMARIISILFLLSAVSLQAQNPILESISIEQGLSQGFISSITQDEDGFLWFATSNGLNRYDGYEFKVFRNDPYDSLSITGNGIFSIAATGDFIWLMPNALQFNILHRATHKAFPVPVELSEKSEIFKVVPAINNTVWILMAIDGVKNLFKLQWHSNFMSEVSKGVSLETLFQWEEIASNVRDITLSEDGKQLWILDSENLCKRDILSGKTEYIKLAPEISALTLERTKLITNVGVLPDFEGSSWVFGRNQVAKYDGKNWRIFPLGFQTSGLLNFDRKAGLIWLRADSIVYGFELRNLEKSIIPEKAIFTLNIPEQAICSHTDRDGNVWFGTNTRGIRKFSPRRNVFRNYFEGNSFYASPVFDNSGRAWLNEPGRGTNSGGVLDFETGKFVKFPELGLQVKSNEALRIVKGENDRMWIASGNGWNTPSNTISGVLIEYSTERGVLDIIPFPESFINPVRFEMNYQAPGELWFANHYQIMRFDTDSRKFSLFEMKPAPKGIKGINAFVKTPDNTWWSGTPNGLLKAEPNGSEGFNFTLIQSNPKDRNSLPGNFIKSLLPDPYDAGLLWIGTSDNGMTCYNIKSNQFTHYNTENGLPDNTIYGILAEPGTEKLKERALWISSNRGLTRFSPEQNNFQYYFKSDGLQENEFNTYAYGTTPRGELIFGGINGFTIFNPNDIKVSTRPLSIKITGLKVNGQAQNPRTSDGILMSDICFTNRIELSFEENNLQLSFATDDYTNPSRNQFAFYLEGAESKWAHRGFEHTAQYLNLAPGSYTFWVKAANSDGVWSENPLSLSIIIRPPWYRSIWAYIVYFLIFSGALYAFYRFQLKRKLERAEGVRLKEMDEFKSRFFTNISHEFRTPLTVILGTADRMKELNDNKTPDINKNLSLIKRSGENLLRLVNQILDLAKLESNTLTLHYIQGNVSSYLNYVAESLHSLANARNVLLQVDNKQPEIIMDFDPERLLQIVYNLLSNAIKFTPSGGRVLMAIDQITKSKDGTRSFLQLTVKDTGPGIPAEDKPYLFDRFFQAKNQEFAKAGGSGIGLSLTSELVKAMGGSIAVESEEGKGASFTVLLPVFQKAVKGQWQEGLSEISIENSTSENLNQGVENKRDKSELPALLIIEDNPDVVEFLGNSLESSYQLDFAFNGRAGIERALETIPDIIISDVMMPEKDGFEVCETLKQDERTSHIPIILLTAKATLDDRVTGLVRGADAYIAKPFHSRELNATLSGLIELRKKLQKRYASATAVLPPAADKGQEIEDAFLKKFRAAVEERLGDAELSGDDICRKLGMSYPVVYRKLSALTGRSLNVYIRLIRLQKASELLSDPSLSISEIAYQTGFNDPKFFSRVFSEEFNASPTEYRKNII